MHEHDRINNILHFGTLGVVAMVKTVEWSYRAISVGALEVLAKSQSLHTTLSHTILWSQDHTGKIAECHQLQWHGLDYWCDSGLFFMFYWSHLTQHHVPAFIDLYLTNLDKAPLTNPIYCVACEGGLGCLWTLLHTHNNAPDGHLACLLVIKY